MAAAREILFGKDAMALRRRWDTDCVVMEVEFRASSSGIDPDYFLAIQDYLRAHFDEIVVEAAGNRGHIRIELVRRLGAGAQVEETLRRGDDASVDLVFGEGGEGNERY